jgi:hypothetical protein
VLKTAGKQGSVTKRITVTSNDPKTPSLVLEISVEITVDVLVEPRNVVFKQLDKGAEATELLSVKVAEPDKIKVTEIAVGDPLFELKMTAGDQATDSKWELKFKGSKKLGTFQAKLAIKYTAADAPQTLEVPIRASVVGDLQYVRSIHFGKSATGVFSEREVRFSSRSGKTVKIKKVEDPDGLLKIDVATPTGNPAVLKATVLSAEGDYSKPTQHVLKVYTSDPDEPIAEVSYMISLRGTGRVPFQKGLDALPIIKDPSAIKRGASNATPPPAPGSNAPQKPSDKP